MKKRVSLSIEKSVLDNAKLFAAKRGTSISEIVEEYLRKIIRPIERKTIIDIIEELGPSNIDPKANLKELYYQDPKHGG